MTYSSRLTGSKESWFADSPISRYRERGLHFAFLPVPGVAAKRIRSPSDPRKPETLKTFAIMKNFGFS